MGCLARGKMRRVDGRDSGGSHRPPRRELAAYAWRAETCGAVFARDHRQTRETRAVKRLTVRAVMRDGTK
jgi:hypothetical protein